MQDLFRSIWSALGVPQLWGFILTLVIIVAVYFVRLFIDQALKNQSAEFANKLQTQSTTQIEKFKSELQMQSTTQIEKLKSELQSKLLINVGDRQFIQSQYVNLHAVCQELAASLRDAYIRLFEGEGNTATEEAIAKIALEVDNNIMRPFRRYQMLLDGQTIDKVFYVHNILAQVYDNPSSDTIASFRSFKNKFYKAISDASHSLQPELILQRKGIVDYEPYKPQGG